MDFNQLKLSLKEKLLPAYVIHGQDGFLRNNALTQIKNKIKFPETNISVYSDDSAAFLKTLGTYPMFSDYRLVIVNNPKKCVDGITGYLDNPYPFAVLVIHYDGEPSKAVLKKAEEVVCDKLDEKFIKSYIVNYAAKFDVTFSPQAINTLINYAQNDMAFITKETEKLTAYAGSYGTVTETTVEEITEPAAEFKLYELAEALGKKDTGKAFGILNNLINNKVEYTVILSSLYNHFRRLLHISLHPTEDICGLLGIKPYAEKMMRQQAKNFSQVSLKNITDEIFSGEYNIKNGKGAPADVLNLMILKIIKF